jgi:hypothetical protein
MYYSQNEFFRLMEAIEDQGGEHLDQTHDPIYHTDLAGDNPKVKGFEMVYCGLDVLFEIPYEGLDKNGDEIGVQPITACAVDDWIGRWPRFAHAKAPGEDS